MRASTLTVSGLTSGGVFWIAVGGVLLASRLAHTTILWADEDYHLAAAVQLLHGKMLYRDVWYDKPPLGALWALLWGAWPGWSLRFVSAATAIASCWLAFRLAAKLWTPREGFASAALVGFYQVFYFAHATIPVEPDTLLLLPHLAAIYCAVSRRPFLAGAAAGLAFLLTPKGGAVLAACLVFHPAGWIWMAAGFLLPNAIAAVWLIGGGAWTEYVAQVWRWGLLYAGSPPDESAGEPVLRLIGWLGFHAAIALGAVFTWRRRPLPAVAAQCLGWFVISLIAAAIGWRMLPRYLNQILPPLAILAAPGLVWLWNARRVQRMAVVATGIALAVPMFRFGPRYLQLIAETAFSMGVHDWVDVRMDQESRRAADIVLRITQPGDTIFIWGYRPNVVAYTRMPVASRYWESQPLTGVAADRHLGESRPLDPEWARRNREEVVRSKPTIIVDGLSRYNPALDWHYYPEIAEWMKQYCRISDEAGIVIYRRCQSLP